MADDQDKEEKKPVEAESKAQDASGPPSRSRKPRRRRVPDDKRSLSSPAGEGHSSSSEGEGKEKMKRSLTNEDLDADAPKPTLRRSKAKKKEPEEAEKKADAPTQPEKPKRDLTASNQPEKLKTDQPEKLKTDQPEKPKRDLTAPTLPEPRQDQGTIDQPEKPKQDQGKTDLSEKPKQELAATEPPEKPKRDPSLLNPEEEPKQLEEAQQDLNVPEDVGKEPITQEEPPIEPEPQPEETEETLIEEQPQDTWWKSKFWSKFGHKRDKEKESKIIEVIPPIIEETGLRRRFGKTPSQENLLDNEEVEFEEEEEDKPNKPPGSWGRFKYDVKREYKKFCREHAAEREIIRKLRNRCINDFIVIFIYCGLGAFVFKFTEGAFESFYKCGVKRVKRDFINELWTTSHFKREDEWKLFARRKLMEFENQLHDAFEAGMKSYSGQKSWSFLNAIIYCFTVVSTIGYGHIAPTTTTGRFLTIIYAVFGIPMFLILLADFGKMFTRGIKWAWAFVRRLYYTGTCKKVRKTEKVMGVMKGVQVVYDIATFRRGSGTTGKAQPENNGDTAVQPPSEEPPTPVPAQFEIDDEFNLPISVALVILLLYIFGGAVIIHIWEDGWTFFESFYFVFISMSTIGFGDFVPQNKMYMMGSIVYLAFGLALTSMCINVVQEKLSDTFRKATAKIGATIGLRVYQDDGTVTPVAPPKVELAQVHRSS